MTEVLASLAAKEIGSIQPPAAFRSLDDLLERYLNLLDAYQGAQQDLTKQLSSGFISLAQANFTSPNKIRYGQDFYDGRMQATTIINIEETKFPDLYTFSTDTSTTPTPEASGGPSQQSAPKSIPSDERKEASDSEASSLEKVASNIPIDPIKWFGMFVPQALRTAQSRFRSAVSRFPSLASIVEEMRQVEAEVERLRGELKTYKQK